MASVACHWIERVTAHAQRDSLDDARGICANGTYFLNISRTFRYPKCVASLDWAWWVG